MASSYPYDQRPDDETSFPMKADGHLRGCNRMQRWVLPESDHPPATGRYHLLVNYSCGWSHQVLLARSLKGLQEVISVSHTFQHPVRPNGWPLLQPDPTGNGFNSMFDVYNSNNPEYGNRQLTVPVFFDKQAKKVVSNDPAQILLMLNEAFNDWATNPRLDLYPAGQRTQIEDINSILWPGLNDGVYRCGFSGSDAVYKEAHEGLQGALKWIDSAIGKDKFLCGDEISMADVRAFPHLFRFDIIYRHLMLRSSKDPPLLSLSEGTVAYMERLFIIPGVRETCDPHLAVVGYWAQLGAVCGKGAKKIEEDDMMYEEFKYPWMPSREELEKKRLSEGLPEKGEHHVTEAYLANL